ncbi:hypothetical protein [Lactococcus taiwanensis]|uniref:hypothetical protein n=1 Tax=Lactococcus taiwanensis TaxID=1151742 RepID=UPI0035135E44
MSKYNTLWQYLKQKNRKTFKLTFEEIERIAKVPIDHSFLNYKRELMDYGYEVEKISIKDKTVIFTKIS